MNTERVSFLNQAGCRLTGFLEHAPGPPRAYALFAHCFSCSSQSHAARRISKALANIGISTLRFDFTGLGESEGDFADSHFVANVDDLVHAAAYLQERCAAPALLIGHSLGGTAVIAAAARLPGSLAVVTIGAPFDPAHALHHFGDAGLAAIEQTGSAAVTIGGRPFTVGRDFITAARASDQAHLLADLHKALLVMHAPTDTIVGIDNARMIYDAARHPKSFVSLDKTDHLLTDERTATYVATVIAAWSSHVLPAAAPDEVEIVSGVEVDSTGQTFQKTIRAGRHTLAADEPVALGGNDAGPTPYDLLLAALGACTAMTIELYARKKSIPLQHVQVRLTHGRHHVQDCEGMTGRVERITRELRLTGDLTVEQRLALVAVADRCPVHRTLVGEIAIETVEVSE